MYTEEGSLFAEVVDNVQLHQNSTAPLQNGSSQLCLGETTAKTRIKFFRKSRKLTAPKGAGYFPSASQSTT